MKTVKTDNDKFVVENYADVLAVAYDLEVISFDDDGGYQGEYLAILTDGERLFYFIDYYGSCSGCDWLESERNWNDNTITYKQAIEYIADVKPKYIVPKDKPLTFVRNISGDFELENK
jgi:hypothetical protein